MRIQALAASVLVAVAAWPCALRGDVIVSLNNPGSTALHEMWVEPGETFSVDVNLDAGATLYSISFLVQASENSFFEIAGRTNQSPWLEGSSGLGPLASLVGWKLPDPQYFGPGDATLGTLEFAVAPDTPETIYAISASNVRFWSSRITPTEYNGAAGADFIVHVVPEPASLLLLLPVLFFLRRPR